VEAIVAKLMRIDQNTVDIGKISTLIYKIRNKNFNPRGIKSRRTNA
jgi:hypothetical protein